MTYKLILLLLPAIASIQLSNGMTVTCVNNVFTVNSTEGQIVFQEDCSLRSLYCDPSNGCTSASSQIQFLCPATDNNFSMLGNCNRYYTCDGGDATPTDCNDGQLYHPVQRTCVPSAVFNRTTSCHRLTDSCRRNSGGLLYFQPLPADPFVYVACSDNRVIYTAGCATYYDSAARPCAPAT